MALVFWITGIKNEKARAKTKTVNGFLLNMRFSLNWVRDSTPKLEILIESKSGGRISSSHQRFFHSSGESPPAVSPS